jgi:type IV pilus assembly protein PilM
MMLSRTKSRSLVGLDIEAGSVAATEVTTNGSTSVSHFGVAPLGPGVFREGEVADAAALGAALKDLFAQHKLSKSVRVGVANQRIAVRTLQLPAIEDRGELETAIRFQAQDHIPMPLEQAVLDWQVVSRGTGESGEPRMEVVAVAARRDMLTGVLEAVKAAGLKAMGIDVSAFGMIRALVGDTPVVAPVDEVEGAPVPMPARLYCNLGDVTNLAVARASACVFTRVSPFGVEGVAQKLAERRQLTLEHAREWLAHVGLEQPVESVEGDRETVSAARDALIEGASKLADELRLSLDYYAAQEGTVAVESAVACGPGTTIPGLVHAIQSELGLAFEVGRPRALSHLDEASAARLTLSYGLALEA